MPIDTVHEPYGLSAATVKKIITIFAAHSTIEQAILYGSRAKGTYHSGSDIDLALVGEGLSYVELGQIENELDDLLLPYTCDLSLLTHIANTDLLAHIKRVGLIFYQK